MINFEKIGKDLVYNETCEIEVDGKILTTYLHNIDDQTHQVSLEKGDRTIGFISLQKKEKNGEEYYEIVNPQNKQLIGVEEFNIYGAVGIGVLPEFTENGLGKIVLQLGINVTTNIRKNRDQSTKEIEIRAYDVEPHNIEFYENNNFQMQIGIDKTTYFSLNK